MPLFTKAVKTERKLRMAITGPSGAGKTFSALAIAQALGDRIAVIDTEHGGATLYADEFDFDHVALESFAPEMYRTYLHGAGQEGYPVVIVDTITHAWMGKDGVLETVDREKARSQRGNDFAAWQVGTKKQTEFVETLLSVPFHLIVTMRSKMDYVLEAGPNGKTSPKKLGMAPVQREGIEYEFDVIGDMDLSHTMVITKSRLRAMADRVVSQPGRDFGDELLRALTSGAVAMEPLKEVGQLLRQYVSPLQHTGLRNALLHQVFSVDTPTEVQALAPEAVAQGLPLLRGLCVRLPQHWEKEVHPDDWIKTQVQALVA